MKRFIFSSLLSGVACLAATMARAEPSFAGGVSGSVYTIDNSTNGNNVMVFTRTTAGRLAWNASVSTGGRGTGAGLGSQGAVLLSRDGHWLFVCNAGSDEISVFSVARQGLQLASRVHSQGRVPISLTQDGNLLYVLNAGGSAGDRDNIAGFTFAAGQLSPLAGSARSLSASNTGPAQVSFTADGQVLVVTEKSTSRIDTFTVGADGLVQAQKTFASPATTPFGFAPGRHDRIFVSNADGSSLSSYSVSADGDISIISDAVLTHQAAACWVALTRDRRYGYTANAVSGSISGYAIAPDGRVELLDADGRTGVTGNGSKPVDMALSRDSRFLYVLDTGNGTIAAFRVQADGSLQPMLGVSGVSTSASGLAAE